MRGTRGALALCALVVVSACGAGRETLPALPHVSTSAKGPVELDGNSVELFTDGAAVVHRLIDAVDAAQRRVEAEIYEFDRPELVAAMLRALSRGVAVVVIADPTVGVDRATLRTLSQAGAGTWLYPVGKFQIDHVKLLLVDGSVALFGGMNWGRRSYLNHDFELCLRGPLVVRLEAIFAADLLRSGAVDTRLPALSASPPLPMASISLAATAPADEIRPRVLSALAAARTYVFLEMFVLTDSAVIYALCAAARRGVRVFALFDPNQQRNRSAAQTLLAAGAHPRFYVTAGEKLHAKAAVIDGTELLMGSANWTASGFTRNHELDAILLSPPLASQALARMEEDWEASAPPSAQGGIP